MANDLFTLYTLADELSDTLSGAKVEKIFQPESDEFRFALRSKGQSKTLVMSCNSKIPRVYITEEKKSNPISAPAFCMLLRKHLSVSTLSKVEIVNYDRVLKFTFIAKSEMKDVTEKRLYVEIINRYSNIVFTDGNDIILEAVKKTSIDQDSFHPIIRGTKYLPLTQSKIGIFSPEAAILIENANTDLPISDFIINNFSGFSKQTLKEMLRLADIDRNTVPTAWSLEKVLQAVGRMKNAYGSEIYRPCVQNGEICVFPFEGISGETKSFDTLSEAFDVAVSKRDIEVRMSSKTKHLKKAISRQEERILKHKRMGEEKLKECAGMDKFRLYGDLILTNIYKIKKGDTALTAYDYESGAEILVPLDLTKSPSDNAKQYFSKYQKLKRTKKFLEVKMVDDELLLDYVHSIASAVNSLKIDDNFDDIEDELTKIGAIRTKKVRNKRKDKRQPPKMYIIENFKVYKGRNNLQNDELTFKIANASDIWLHVKNAPSAHVVIITEGNVVPENVIKIAAEILSSDGAGTEIDYTQRRNVRRIKNGHPGQVTYSDYKTIIVEQNPHIELETN